MSKEKLIPKQSFAKSQARFILRFAPWILIFFALSTAALIPVAARLKLHANFLDLLPASYPSVKNLKELTSYVGGTSFLIAVFESGDEDSVGQAAKEFAEKAAAFPEVDYIDNRTNIPAFENRKLLFLSLEGVAQVKKYVQDLVSYHRRKNNPFFIDLLNESAPTLDPSSLPLEEKISRIGGFSSENAGSFMRVVLMKPRHPVSEFIKSKELFEQSDIAFNEIQKSLNHPVTLGFTGPYRTRYNEYHTIKKDLQRTGLVATILLLLVNFMGFRNLRSIIYAYLPLAIGTVWIWAFTEMTIGYLNLITSFLAAILFAMGGDYTLHILVSFEEDLRKTKNTESALEMTFTDLWRPLWSSMWTTVVVFYAMTVSQFQGFHQFGVIAGAGIMVSFVIVLYVEPSLIVLGEKYFPVKRPPPRQKGKIPTPAIYAIIIIGILFSLYSATQISRVKFNYDFSELRAKGDNAVELSEKIGAHFGMHLMPVAFITPDREQAKALVQTLNRHIETTPDTTFDFAASIQSHVPRDQKEKIWILSQIQGILKKYDSLILSLDPKSREQIAELENQLRATPLTYEDLPAKVRQQYEGTDQKISAVFVYPKIRIMDGKNAKRFVRELRSIQLPPNVKLAGEPVIYADILGLIERDTPVAISLSVVLVFLLILWHFKRLDHTLWVHAPLVLGIFWMEGMMGLTHLTYNFFNMAIIPGILGVGIDNGIYIFNHFKESRTKSFFETMRKSLKGVLMASATNLSAFAALMFATHNGIASLGKLGFFGFLSCLLGSVFFIPAVIEFAELRTKAIFRRNERTKTKKPI